MTGAPENISQRTLWPYFWALLIFTSLVVGALTYNNYRQFRDNYYTSLLTDAEKRIEGLEATIEIKEYYGDQSPIIITLTANAMKEDRDRFLAAGMDDYLSKPFHQNDLIARIQVD